MPRVQSKRGNTLLPCVWQVQLLQEMGTPREEPPVTPGRAPAKGAPAPPPPGMVDLSQLTLGPCALIPADRPARGQGVALQVHSAGPLPEPLQAAASAAGLPTTQHPTPAPLEPQNPRPGFPGLVYTHHLLPIS